MRNICVLTDVNNIVIAYGICLSDRHIPIENGIIIETDLDLEKVNLVGNYKLINGELVELTEDEKPIIELQPTEIEILKQEKEVLAQSVYELSSIVELILTGGI